MSGCLVSWCGIAELYVLAVEDFNPDERGICWFVNYVLVSGGVQVV